MTPSATIAGRGRAGSPLTREKVIERIVRWAALYGAPPTTADWNPSVARWRAQEWRAERYRLGDPVTGERWPSTTAAKRRFDGSFDAALRAAGYAPHPSGPRPGAAAAGARQDRSGALAPTSAPSRPGGAGAGAREDRSGALAPTSAPSRDRAADAEPRAGSAIERARVAERAVKATERAHRAEAARAQRAEARAAAARKRARVLGDRARRAMAARERARAELAVARGDGAVREAAAAAEADARLQAAEDRATAATRDAQRARGLASASVREAARLRDALAGALARAEDAEDVARGALMLRADREGAEADAHAPDRPPRGTARRDGGAARIARGPAAPTPERAPRLSPAELDALRAAAGPGGPAVLAEALRALAEARSTNDRVRLDAALAMVAAAAVGWRDRL